MMDERVVKLWREGKFKEFCTMLPEYADYCYGEGNMQANSSVINSTLPSYLSQPSRPSSITVSCMLPSPYSYTREFDHQMDERVVKLWREGKFKEFCTMLPEYARRAGHR
jgi:aromatic ring-opening dioxygenase catalytic subunit (LigB family)